MSNTTINSRVVELIEVPESEIQNQQKFFLREYISGVSSREEVYTNLGLVVVSGTSVSISIDRGALFTAKDVVPMLNLLREHHGVDRKAKLIIRNIEPFDHLLPDNEVGRRSDLYGSLFVVKTSDVFRTLKILPDDKDFITLADVSYLLSELMEWNPAIANYTIKCFDTAYQ